ncbi:hypothetical protein GALMADRAFT_259236 [Galerina marginata CBS 339.88]|uniref:Cytochrome P450 n=1 Tax=Galerina marginata (strain CBS 339.88) TaxID=685588 RepID=A0A067SI99_GALM3|nr:hypothetical protein GALMADRAFT_259236 [Galerina marginata CBS 339.88]
MTLPPGVGYLLRLIPRFAIPSAIAYFSLKLLQRQQEIEISNWIVIPIALLARPALFFFNKFYSRRVNKRKAAANGAVLAPSLQLSASRIMSMLGDAIRTGFPAKVFWDWSKEYGNVYQVDLVTNQILYTTEPDHVKAVLATQFDSFDKGAIFHSQMDSLLGTGVFNSDGPMWKFRRAITRPFFTRERISDFEIYDRNCDLALKEAKKRLSEGYPIDFQDLVARFTLDSAAEFLFGGDVGSLSAGIPYPPAHVAKNPPSFYNHPSTAFVNAFMQGLVFAAMRTGMGAEWPLAEFTRDRVAPLRKVVDKFTEPLMQAALDQRERELSGKVKPTDDEETLLAHLVKQTQDPKILKDELINLLVAGRDTTMCLLAFSLYMLAEHPDIETRLRQEIFEKVGPTESPGYEQMREMKYMRAFLNEVLRLYPPVPVDSRTTNSPVVLSVKNSSEKPVYVPANTTCLYAVVNMHRRADLWGPDALEFDPDRFLDERLHKYLTPNPYIFCPFNAGPRICLGQQFAYHEATFYLVRLLQQFTGFTLDKSVNIPPPADWASSGDFTAKETVYPMAHLTMYIKGGLWVHMKELKSSDI